jgi:hypothetical protein
MSIFRIRIKMKARIWIGIKVTSRIRICIRNKVKGRIRIRIHVKVMRIRNTGLQYILFCVQSEKALLYKDPVFNDLCIRYERFATVMGKKVLSLQGIITPFLCCYTCKKKVSDIPAGDGNVAILFLRCTTIKKYSVSLVEHQESPEKFVSFQPFQTTLNVLSDRKDPNYAVIRKTHGSTACTGALFPK